MSEANCESGSTKEVQHEITKSRNCGYRAGQGIRGAPVNPIQSITDRIKDEPVIILFSTGKDSIAASDLFFKHHQGKKQLVYMYLVPGLSFKERILSYYENRWKTDIHRIPGNVSIMLSQGRKVLDGVIEKNLRMRYDINWIVTGLKCSDNLVRRYFGRCADVDGIDLKHRKIYPLKHWKDRQVMAYIKANKLPLPVEYSMGFRRDLSYLSTPNLVWIKSNFPQDYQKIIRSHPKLEVLVWREENRGRE